MWTTHYINIYRRTDGRFGWRCVHVNGHVIATDGSQGYERIEDASAAVANLASAMRWGRVRMGGAK